MLKVLKKIVKLRYIYKRRELGAIAIRKYTCINIYLKYSLNKFSKIIQLNLADNTVIYLLKGLKCLSSSLDQGFLLGAFLVCLVNFARAFGKCDVTCEKKVSQYSRAKKAVKLQIDGLV